MEILSGSIERYNCSWVSRGFGPTLSREYVCDYKYFLFVNYNNLWGFLFDFFYFVLLLFILYKLIVVWLRKLFF